jgi:CBS domain-containing protein
VDDETDKIDSAAAKDIMTPFVHMLPTTATLQDVIKNLNINDISAVFIEDKKKSKYYIISQSDIVRFLYEGGLHDPMIDKVPSARIMKGPVSMLDEDTSIDLVIRFMRQKDYKRALISRNGEPVGVISTRDILIWNDIYFKPAEPQALLVVDNTSNLLICQHIFKENISEGLNETLMEMYGGALSSISMITDEILKKKGQFKRLLREKNVILFEPREKITSILISNNNSIEIRRNLHKFTNNFVSKYAKRLNHKDFQVVVSNFKINDLLGPFAKKLVTIETKLEKIKKIEF